MHVLQINKFFYEKGGAERYFFSVSRALEKRGHTVSHFSMRHPSNLESPYEPFFVSERNYARERPQFQEIPAGFSFIRSREAARNLSLLLEKSTPDIAHLHNIYHQITPSIIPVLRRAGVPVVMTLHDYKLICPNYSFFDGKAVCHECLGGRFHRAAAVRCQGSFTRSLLLSVEAYWQRMTRVYDGVRFFLAPSRYMRDTFVAEGFSPDRVVYLAPFIAGEEPVGDMPSDARLADSLPEKFVLYFGRLSPEKGLFTLLDAVGRLTDVSLVVCGDGPLRKELEERASHAKSQVLFAGHLNKPDVDAVVRRSTAVVLPSEWPENAPFTVLEAMAAGIPVVVSNMGGLPELIRGGGGLVFEAGSSTELAARILELWENAELSRDIGLRGRRFVAEELTEKRHVDELERLYQKALNTG